MAITSSDDLFVPEVATAVATAEFPDMLALGFPASPFVAPFPPVNRMSKGNMVKFPRYDTLSAFEELAPSGTLTPEVLTTSVDEAPVRVWGKAVEIDDFADLEADGDHSAEVGRQIARRGAEKVDDILIEVAETAGISETSFNSQTITYSTFVQAMVDNWGDKAWSMVGGLVVHSKVSGDMMELDEFKRADVLGMPGAAATGFNERAPNAAIGALAGVPVYVSDRLTTTSGSPNTYSNLIFKRNAMGLKFQRTLLVESDRDVLGKDTVIAADVRFAVHLLFGDPLPAITYVTQ